VKLDRPLTLAIEGRLYPSVILHGGSELARFDAVITFARALLCEREAAERPCGVCRHCRRIVPPDSAEAEAASFHPDFLWLARDLKTAVSADATREMLRSAQLSPFEARGQVFVIAEAASLSAEASDALLKAIEEPFERTPRNFFLLAPSRLDLSPTLRSRSLSLHLGAAVAARSG
jgi:DNA polymerase III gamma/tau subunit